jgi:beta-mannanase
MVGGEMVLATRLWQMGRNVTLQLTAIFMTASSSTGQTMSYGCGAQMHPLKRWKFALGEWNNAAAYYPGDEYVDWLCFDGYNFGASSFGQSFNSKWVSFDEIFKTSYAELQAISPDKPIIIGEFASTEEGGDKAAWITDAFTKIEKDYPQIRAIIWFHIERNRLAH